MNWTETREALHKAGAAQTPEKWQWRANLFGADLSGAAINWNSHDLIAELLRQAAGESWQRRALAGLILVSRDWCWKEFLALEHPEQEWALDVLRGYVREGDGAPDFLQEKDDGDELA